MPAPLDPSPGSSGAPDPLVELVAVMRRLRVECSWKAAQTHRSLARHLVEELHETLEAIDLGDPVLLREELGDLLLQVVFHAAIAEQAGEFDLDDVAAGLVAKLVRRNPHVFAPDGAGPADPAAVNELWEQAKATEKRRTDLTEGLPPGLPALLQADKVLDRLARRDGTPGPGAPVAAQPGAAQLGAEELGDRLLALVGEGHAAGHDPEQALRDAVRRLLAVRGSGTAPQAPTD